MSWMICSTGLATCVSQLPSPTGIVSEDSAPVEGSGCLLRNSVMPMESWPADGLGSGQESNADESAAG